MPWGSRDPSSYSPNPGAIAAIAHPSPPFPTPPMVAHFPIPLPLALTGTPLEWLTVAAYLALAGISIWGVMASPRRK
ncbi:MAG: hypothetical protein Fur0042_22180 [Cyanophyceae cyanobacterium]